MKPSRSKNMSLSALLLSVYVFVMLAGAQEKPKEGPVAPPLSVKLNALVTDSKDLLINDLRQEDFQILEDGVPQKITGFGRREGPITFGLVVDNTGSFRNVIGPVVNFCKLLVSGSGPSAEAFVVRFIDSEDIKIMKDLTTDKTALNDALDNMYVEGGQSAINDAVYLSAERLSRYKRSQSAARRYALVLITDGEDRASHYKTEQLIAKLHETGLPVFVVGFVARSYEKTTPEKAKQYMGRLAFETGGSAIFVEKKTDLTQVARQILLEMSANYALDYDSTNPKRDGSTRNIQVTAGGGAGGEARRVVTMDSYLAPRK